METTMRNQILKSTSNVYEMSKGSKLDDTLFEILKEELKFLSEYFKTSEIQSLFLANIFILNFKGELVELSDLVKYFDCNPLKILQYNEEIDSLRKSGYILKSKTKNRFKITFSNNHFILNDAIIEAIMSNSPIPELEQKDFDDLINLLEVIYNNGCRRNDDEITTSELFNQTKILIKQNLHFNLLKTISDYSLEIEDTYLFLYIIWKTLIGKENIDLETAVNGIFDKTIQRVKFMQKMIGQESRLFKDELVELEEDVFSKDAVIKLTTKSLDILNSEGLKVFYKKIKKDNILEPNNIKSKALFFNEQENKQMEMLKKMLHKDKLKEIQNRLIDKNLAKGVAVLLYGSAGTGKTESVYQIARETNREIMKIEISQSKSMWFGESEKIIKRIFTDYKEYAKQSERTPILLFNEADAIISKRKDIGNSNVAQTENTIQNIILEELENFEGIFFATTNLAKNIDTAFERRFLFKIEFHKPEPEIKAKIWKSKLEILTESDCTELSRNFDFTGGQIDNIVRKTEMHNIINEHEAKIYEIIQFCKEEVLSRTDMKSIGFKK